MSLAGATHGTEGRVRTARLALHVRRAGRGPVLLYLGGSNFDMRLRCAVMDSGLPSRFDVIAHEPRGLARSDAPPGDWTMRDYAEDAVSLLDALDIPQALVLGESFGGMTALHLAAHHPDRVRGLALMAATAGGALGASHPVEDWLPLPPDQAARAALRVQDLQFAALERSDPSAAAARHAQRTALERAFRACPVNAAGYPRLLQARARHDAVALLDRIACPAIVMAGGDDGQAPLAAVTRLAEALPQARLWTFQGGHGFGFATPEPVRRLIAAWTDPQDQQEAPA